MIGQIWEDWHTIGTLVWGEPPPLLRQFVKPFQNLLTAFNEACSGWRGESAQDMSPNQIPLQVSQILSKPEEIGEELP